MLSGGLCRTFLVLLLSMRHVQGTVSQSIVRVCLLIHGEDAAKRGRSYELTKQASSDRLHVRQGQSEQSTCFLIACLHAIRQAPP